MILKLKSFNRWANSEGIRDSALIKAVHEVVRGLIDADLGAGLLKKRVARDGEGKRGGFRTLLAFRRDKRFIFMLGYPKSSVDNIGTDELAKLKQLARELLNATDLEIQQAIVSGDLIKVKE